MKIPTLSRPKVELSEVHQYVQDLQQVTLLRDKAMPGEEWDRYTKVLAHMQLVLLYLNRLREPKQ